MTLDEEFDNEFNIEGIDHLAQAQKDWFKSYITNLMKDAKLEEKKTDGSTLYATPDDGYNQALSDQEAKIAEELKKRGI